MISCHLKLIIYNLGGEGEYPGRKSRAIYQPDHLFMSNIEDYKYNRFLNIGINELCSSSALANISILQLKLELLWSLPS